MNITLELVGHVIKKVLNQIMDIGALIIHHEALNINTKHLLVSIWNHNLFYQMHHTKIYPMQLLYHGVQHIGIL